MTKEDIFFLELLRLAISSDAPKPTIQKQEWDVVFLMAQSQGLTGVAFEAIEKLPKDIMPPIEVLMNWFGRTEYLSTAYAEKRKLSLQYADALAEVGVKCIVLKGLAISSYYQKPEHREFGDLDCFLIQSSKNAFEKGNKVGRKIGASVEAAGYKHSHIHYKSMLIENHEYLTNFNETKQGVKIEKIMQRLVHEGGWRRFENSNLWIPSPEFNVLFLLKHSLVDFIAQDMSFRSIYDWAVFMKAEQSNIKWTRMFQLLDECKLHKFFDVMTHICMRYLGLQLSIPNIVVSDESKLAEYVVYDILHKPHVTAKIGFLKKAGRIWNRFKRMHRYASLETESYCTLVWNTFAFSSYAHRSVKLD